MLSYGKERTMQVYDCNKYFSDRISRELDGKKNHEKSTAFQNLNNVKRNKNTKIVYAKAFREIFKTFFGKPLKNGTYVKTTSRPWLPKHFQPESIIGTSIESK